MTQSGECSHAFRTAGLVHCTVRRTKTEIQSQQYNHWQLRGITLTSLLYCSILLGHPGSWHPWWMSFDMSFDMSTTPTRPYRTGAPWWHWFPHQDNGCCHATVFSGIHLGSKCPRSKCDMVPGHEYQDPGVPPEHCTVATTHVFLTSIRGSNVVADQCRTIKTSFNNPPSCW